MEEAGAIAYFWAIGFLVANLGYVVANKKKQSAVGGQKPIPSLLKRFEVPLDKLEAKLALRLGDGDLALGIRRAIVFASIRQLQ